MIRKFEKKDAKRCSIIIISCINETLNYNKNNKNFLIEMSSPENIIKKSEKAPFFVYELNGEIIGIGGIEKTVQLTEEHKCTYFPGSLSS
jgi:hypothetical protein